MRYSREDGCHAWLAYGLLSPERHAAILEEYGSAEAVYDAFVTTGGACLRECVSPEGMEMLRKQSSGGAMHTMMVTMQRLGIGLLRKQDDVYPALLREIPDAPELLFYRGDLTAIQERMMTVIGTRSPSLQGREAARQIASVLSESGVVIVSGLAEGIDGAAHEGCLEGGASTIGLCASGIDVDYPAGNHELKERIVHEGGLLLSEFPMGLPAFKQNFAIRNRILSGMTRGVVVVEGRIRSGTMLTVHHALDQGREVFAWPGMPGSELTEAAHQLLREGARYFVTAQDILEDMGWDSVPLPTKAEQAALPPLSSDQQKVMQALRAGEQSMDQLAAQTGLPTPSLSTALTMLQIMGLIRSMPGKTYMIV